MTNDFQQITLDLSLEWRAHHRPGAPQLYPADRRDEIDAIAQDVYSDVNHGVYRSGFAGTQARQPTGPPPSEEAVLPTHNPLVPATALPHPT